MHIRSLIAAASSVFDRSGVSDMCMAGVVGVDWGFHIAFGCKAYFHDKHYRHFGEQESQ